MNSETIRHHCCGIGYEIHRVATPLPLFHPDRQGKHGVTVPGPAPRGARVQAPIARREDPMPDRMQDHMPDTMQGTRPDAVQGTAPATR